MKKTFSCNNKPKLKRLLEAIADKSCGKLFALNVTKPYVICWFHLLGDDVIPRKRVEKDSSIGAIVGGVVGGVLVILLVIAVVLIVRRKQKKNKAPPKPLPSVSYSVVVCIILNQTFYISIISAYLNVCSANEKYSPNIIIIIIIISPYCPHWGVGPHSPV